jgi:Asp-tRNA(Asn)/Glu-tRNA(Gln) amidotransferase A subunit family amidase
VLPIPNSSRFVFPSIIAPEAVRLRQGETTAQEIVSTHLEKILVTDETIGSFVSQQADAALLQAKEIDRKLSVGLDPGLLAGIPFGIKDNICVSNMPSTAGSRILEVPQILKCS